MSKNKLYLLLLSLAFILFIPFNVKASTEDVSPFKVGDTFEDSDLKYQVTSVEKFTVGDLNYYGTVKVLGRKSGDYNDYIFIYPNTSYYSYTSHRSYYYRVTEIAPYAFKNDKYLVCLYINPGCHIKTIPKGMCLKCKNLQNVSINGLDIEIIGQQAFAGCKKLCYITMPTKNLKKINKNAFKNAGVKYKYKLIQIYKPLAKKYKKMLKKGGLTNYNFSYYTKRTWKSKFYKYE